MTYFSQFGQDKFLEEHIFKHYKNGIFVDVGAHNGKSINNTLYFEQNNNWTGINVEPLPHIYKKLKNNRPNCINLNCAVSNIDGSANFICNEGYTEMLSGLEKDYDIRHLNRRDREIKQMGGSTKIIEVKTNRLETILNEYNIDHINYLSIDVEGGEFNVIKSINFDKVFIDVIGFENNYNDVSIPIVTYLSNNGFKIIHKSLDIFMIHKDSQFLK
jgi:FkbM family methyltransferase